jgi:hypothetical protein
MKPALLLALLATATLLQAGVPSSASSSTLVVIAGVRAGETPVAITVPADYMAVEIRIESDEADWSLKLAGIEETRRELAAAAAREKFRLRIDRALVFQPRYQKLSFSSSPGAGQHDAHSDILILAPIDENTDLVPLVRRIRSLITELKPAKKVSVASGNLFLALENPERHRAALLGQIRAHVDATSLALTDARTFTVTGLDGPLRLRQSGELHIDVYLPFQATYAH